MSHEIRTPLNAIIGFANLLQRDKLEPQQERKVQHIRGASDTLLAIVNDILDYSKIEAGKIDLERTSFTIGAVVTKIEGLLGLQAAKNDIRLETELPSGPDTQLVGDPVRVEQIILNLTSNAVKFSKGGRVSVKARIRRSPHKGRAVVTVSVRDTGIGIPPEKLTSIFEAFRQADTSSTRQYGGTGLGLAITRHLVTLMGGRIRVESQVGQGSCFTVKIPFKLAAEAQVVMTSEILDTLRADHSEARLDQLRVLVVEDNEVNQMITTSLLKAYGAEVDVASNGGEAVEKVARNAFDIILMDCQMPIMDGYEATSRIRSLQAAAGSVSTPILALTAHAFQSDREKCLSVGMNGHLSKPVNPSKLIEAIQFWTGSMRPEGGVYVACA